MYHRSSSRELHDTPLSLRSLKEQTRCNRSIAKATFKFTQIILYKFATRKSMMGLIFLIDNPLQMLPFTY